MKSTKDRRGYALLAIVSILLSVLLMPIPSAYGAPQQTATDNTKVNQGDSHKTAATADRQSNNPQDLNTTKQIRAAIVKDKSLSTYAHNAKIVTQSGVVTLLGPVKSEEERSNLIAKAVAVVGEQNVRNELTIASGKP